jgi:anti-sigma factor RsiW
MELINAEIDGELTRDEQAELDAMLESSADLRAMQAELRNLASMLNSLPEQTPPPDLASRVLGQIQLPRSEPAFSLAGLFALFKAAPTAVAFAAGLLVTVGVYEVASESDDAMDSSRMVGTMVSGLPGQANNKKDSLAISVPGLSGTVSLSESGAMRILNFDLDSVEQTEIVIALAEAQLGFGGIARAAPSGMDAEQSYRVSEGTLRMVNQGRQAFSVFLLEAANQDGKSREISIGIFSDGAPVFSGVLRG